MYVNIRKYEVIITFLIEFLANICFCFGNSFVMADGGNPSGLISNIWGHLYIRSCKDIDGSLLVGSRKWVVRLLPTMDWKKLYFLMIYNVYSFFQRLSVRGKLEYALDHVYDNAQAALKRSRTTIKRAVRYITNGPSDLAVADVVAALHGQPDKRSV